MVIAVLFLVILFSAVVCAAVCLVAVTQMALARCLKRSPSNTAAKRLKKSTVLFTALTAGIILLVVFSQLTSHTPPISDQKETGKGKSISSLEKVELNGRQEWISIRGENRNNPVLLFLAGGPGGSQLAATRYALSGLEERFVVVNWDQPGSGKSYNAASKYITVDTYIKDGLALTDLLRKRFAVEKIYLMGESWGSALGIFLASNAPEKYNSFIGTGQMVDFKETEITDYKKAMELAKKNNDGKVVEKLTVNGMPPYYGNDVTWKSAVYLSYLSDTMTKNVEISNSGYHTIRDMFASEYGLIDSVNYFKGVINTFNRVYPQLYDIDLRKSFKKLKVPVYFFIGRHDVNAPISLTQEYYDLLEAPKKEIVWFDHSGHDPWMNESNLFTNQTIRVFLRN